MQTESGKLMNGAEMLLECLAREGVDCFFGYPGGVTLPFYDALYDSHIRHVLVRHEENACFAAEGYARATGKVGVCCATSGPGATNLVTGLVDAMMDSIPIVAITGQVHSKLIGSDAFQEADTFGITRPATKHNFMVKSLQELPRIVHEAFYIAASGRPGPVLVDIPKDVFQARGHYTPVDTIHLPGYKVFTEGHAGQIRRAAQLIWEAERPFVYAGGGTVLGKASAELTELVDLVDLPAVCTLMALGGLSSSHPNFISMPGMHGSYAANMGMTECDLLIALGTRFDDRVTGQLQALRPPRPRHSRRYRSRRSRQEPRARYPDRGRRKARAPEAQQEPEGARSRVQTEEGRSARPLVDAASAPGRTSILTIVPAPKRRSSRST